MVDFIVEIYFVLCLDYIFFIYEVTFNYTDFKQKLFISFHYDAFFITNNHLKIKIKKCPMSYSLKI